MKLALRLQDPANLIWVGLLVVAQSAWASLHFLLPRLLYVFLLSYAVIGVFPKYAPYRSFGLSTQVWRKHGRVAATVVAVLAALPMGFDSVWWGVAAVGLTWMWVMVGRKEPAVPLEKRLLDSSGIGDSKIGRFGTGVLAQTVYRSQIRIWGAFLAGMVFAGLVVLAIAALVQPAWPAAVGSIPILGSFFGLILVQGTMRTSLQNLLTLGGRRAEWAKATALCGLALPVAASLLAVGWWAILGEEITFLAAIAFILCPAATYFAIANRRLWWPLAILAAVVTTVWWLFNAGHLSNVTLLVAAVVGYALFAATLPALTRRWNLSATGLADWLGLRP